MQRFVLNGNPPVEPDRECEPFAARYPPVRSNEPRHSIDRFATHRIHGDGAERVVTVKAGARAFTHTSVPFHGPKIAPTSGRHKATPKAERR